MRVVVVEATAAEVGDECVEGSFVVSSNFSLCLRR